MRPVRSTSPSRLRSFGSPASRKCRSALPIRGSHSFGSDTTAVSTAGWGAVSAAPGPPLLRRWQRGGSARRYTAPSWPYSSR